MKPLTFLLLMTISYCQGQQKINSILGGHATIYKTPGYTAKAFKEILVVTNVRNKDKAWEDRFLKNFRQNKFNVIGELDLFPPLRDYSEKEVKEACDSAGVDGIMTIIATDKDNLLSTVFGYGFYQVIPLVSSDILLMRKIFITITLYDTQLKKNVAVIYGNSMYTGPLIGDERMIRRFTRMVVSHLRPEGVLE